MDRNLKLLEMLILVHTSLSARRAWIEIPKKVSVVVPSGSLSARRAWIEISHELATYCRR